MARHWFLGGVADWAFTTAEAGGVANLAQLVGGAPIQFWNARTGGTRYVDLLDVDDNPIDEAVASDGGDGAVIGSYAPIQGPDEITYMWAGSGDGPRFLVAAWDLGPLVYSAIAQALVAEEVANEASSTLSALLVHVPAVLVHNGTGYPPKPPGVARAIYIGDTQPVSHVGDGDIWLQRAVE